MEIALVVPPPQSSDDDNVAGTGNGSIDGLKASSFSASSLSSPRDSMVNGPNALSSVKYDDDDEEDVCWICRNPGDAENPLRYLCTCSGSIKFAHQDCFLQWLNHNNARQREKCWKIVQTMFDWGFSFGPRREFFRDV